MSSDLGKALPEVVFRLCIGLWAVLPLRIFIHTLALGKQLWGEGLERHWHWVVIHQDTLDFVRGSVVAC